MSSISFPAVVGFTLWLHHVLHGSIRSEPRHDVGLARDEQYGRADGARTVAVSAFNRLIARRGNFLVAPRVPRTVARSALSFIVRLTHSNTLLRANSLVSLVECSERKWLAQEARHPRQADRMTQALLGKRSGNIFMKSASSYYMGANFRIHCL
jgi:hypothetical protein